MAACNRSVDVITLELARVPWCLRKCPPANSMSVSPCIIATQALSGLQYLDSKNKKTALPSVGKATTPFLYSVFRTEPVLQFRDVTFRFVYTCAPAQYILREAIRTDGNTVSSLPLAWMPLQTSYSRRCSSKIGTQLFVRSGEGRRFIAESSICLPRVQREGRGRSGEENGRRR